MALRRRSMRTMQRFSMRRPWEHNLPRKAEQFWTPTQQSLAAFIFDGQEKLKPEGGTVPYVQGQPGMAASFDGKSYLDTGLETKLDIYDPFTLTAWVRSIDSPDGS